MTGMAMTSPMPSGAVAKERPSYVSQIDGPPDTWPEVAREVTMLRGGVESLRARQRELHEVIGVLRGKLRPVLDQTPKADRGSLSALSSEPVPALSSNLGHDLRAIYEDVSNLQAHAEDMTRMVETLTKDVLL